MPTPSSTSAQPSYRDFYAGSGDDLVEPFTDMPDDVDDAVDGEPTGLLIVADTDSVALQPPKLREPVTWVEDTADILRFDITEDGEPEVVSLFDDQDDEDDEALAALINRAQPQSVAGGGAATPLVPVDEPGIDEQDADFMLFI